MLTNSKTMTYNRRLPQDKLERIKSIINEKVTGKIIPKHDESGHHYQFEGTGLILDSVTTINGWIAKHHLAYWAAGCAIDWLEKENRIDELKGPNRENIILGAKKAHTDIRDDAGSVGTQAHNCIESYLKEWIRTGERPKDIRLFFSHDLGETVFGYYIPELNVTITKTDSRAIAAARSAEAVMVREEIIPVAAEILVGHPNYSAGTLDFLCLYKGKLALWDWKTSNSIDEYGYPLQVSAYKKFFEYMTRLKIDGGIKIMKISKDNNSFEEYDVPQIDEAYKAFKLFATFYNIWIKKPKDERIIRVKNRLTI